MPALCAEDLGFAFAGQAPVLCGVNLKLNVGELAVVVGRNGSGKTTLLRLLAGLLTPTEGRVWIEGADAATAREQVGILFQNPDHQMIAPTVEEEIALGLELRGVEPPRIRPVVEELLQRFGLEDLRAAAPEELSGGQKQRVALAAVMAARPPFLLLDEPDSFLDAPSRRELLRAIADLRPVCGMLWVLPQALRLPEAERYYALARGRLQACPREELAARLARTESD